MWKIAHLTSQNSVKLASGMVGSDSCVTNTFSEDLRLEYIRRHNMRKSLPRNLLYLRWYRLSSDSFVKVLPQSKMQQFRTAQFTLYLFIGQVGYTSSYTVLFIQQDNVWAIKCNLYFPYQQKLKHFQIDNWFLKSNCNHWISKINSKYSTESNRKSDLATPFHLYSDLIFFKKFVLLILVHLLELCFRWNWTNVSPFR